MTDDDVPRHEGIECPDCGKILLVRVFASRAELRRVERLVLDRHKEKGNCIAEGGVKQ
jgi:hypothetical protein